MTIFLPTGATSPAAWLVQHDPWLAHVAADLPPEGKAGWLLDDVQWAPGDRCRLAYRVTDDRDVRFVAIDAEPGGSVVYDYREDPGVPGIAAATDPETVMALLENSLGEPVAGFRVRPVRYRPGSRCVLQYDVVTATGAHRLYAKVFTRATFDVTSALATEVAAAVPPSVRLAAVQAVWPDLATIVAEGVEGRRVSLVLSQPRMSVADRVEVAGGLGELLADFHATPPAATAPVRTEADQLWTLHGLRRVVAAVDPELGTRFATAIDLLTSRLPSPAEPDALVHGGFRPGQVVLGASGQLTLLDLDGVCRGSAAQDLATALAHLCWQAVKQPEQDHTLRLARKAFLCGHASRAGGSDSPRLMWWHAAALLQVAGRRFRRLELADCAAVPALLDLAESLLVSCPSGGRPC